MTIEELAYKIEAGDVFAVEVKDAATLNLTLKNHRVTVRVTDIQDIDR